VILKILALTWAGSSRMTTTGADFLARFFNKIAFGKNCLSPEKAIIRF
jgi:hypothetical protein